MPDTTNDADDALVVDIRKQNEETNTAIESSLPANVSWWTRIVREAKSNRKIIRYLLLALAFVGCVFALHMCWIGFGLWRLYVRYKAQELYTINAFSLQGLCDEWTQADMSITVNGGIGMLAFGFEMKGPTKIDTYLEIPDDLLPEVAERDGPIPGSSATPLPLASMHVPPLKLGYSANPQEVRLPGVRLWLNSEDPLGPYLTAILQKCRSIATSQQQPTVFPKVTMRVKITAKPYTDSFWIPVWWTFQDYTVEVPVDLAPLVQALRKQRQPQQQPSSNAASPGLEGVPANREGEKSIFSIDAIKFVEEGDEVSVKMLMAYNKSLLPDFLFVQLPELQLEVWQRPLMPMDSTQAEDDVRGDQDQGRGGNNGEDGHAFLSIILQPHTLQQQSTTGSASGRISSSQEPGEDHGGDHIVVKAVLGSSRTPALMSLIRKLRDGEDFLLGVGGPRHLPAEKQNCKLQKILTGLRLEQKFQGDLIPPPVPSSGGSVAATNAVVAQQEEPPGHLQPPANVDPLNLPQPPEAIALGLIGYSEREHMLQLMLKLDRGFLLGLVPALPLDKLHGSLPPIMFNAQLRHGDGSLSSLAAITLQHLPSPGVGQAMLSSSLRHAFGSANDMSAASMTSAATMSISIQIVVPELSSVMRISQQMMRTYKKVSEEKKLATGEERFEVKEEKKEEKKDNEERDELDNIAGVQIVGDNRNLLSRLINVVAVEIRPDQRMHYLYKALTAQLQYEMQDAKARARLAAPSAPSPLAPYMADVVWRVQPYKIFVNVINEAMEAGFDISIKLPTRSGIGRIKPSPADPNTAVYVPGSRIRIFWKPIVITLKPPSPDMLPHAEGKGAGGSASRLITSDAVMMQLTLKEGDIYATLPDTTKIGPAHALHGRPLIINARISAPRTAQQSSLVEDEEREGAGTRAVAPVVNSVVSALPLDSPDNPIAAFKSLFFKYLEDPTGIRYRLEVTIGTGDTVLLKTPYLPPPPSAPHAVTADGKAQPEGWQGSEAQTAVSRLFTSFIHSNVTFAGFAEGAVRLLVVMPKTTGCPAQFATEASSGFTTALPRQVPPLPPGSVQITFPSPVIANMCDVTESKALKSSKAKVPTIPIEEMQGVAQLILQPMEIRLKLDGGMTLCDIETETLDDDRSSNTTLPLFLADSMPEDLKRTQSSLSASFTATSRSGRGIHNFLPLGLRVLNLPNMLHAWHAVNKSDQHSIDLVLARQRFLPDAATVVPSGQPSTATPFGELPADLQAATKAALVTSKHSDVNLLNQILNACLEHFNIHYQRDGKEGPQRVPVLPLLAEDKVLDVQFSILESTKNRMAGSFVMHFPPQSLFHLMAQSGIASMVRGEGDADEVLSSMMCIQWGDSQFVFRYGNSFLIILLNQAKIGTRMGEAKGNDAKGEASSTPVLLPSTYTSPELKIDFVLHVGDDENFDSVKLRTILGTFKPFKLESLKPVEWNELIQELKAKGQHFLAEQPIDFAISIGPYNADLQDDEIRIRRQNWLARRFFPLQPHHINSQFPRLHSQVTVGTLLEMYQKFVELEAKLHAGHPIPQSENLIYAVEVSIGAPREYKNALALLPPLLPRMSRPDEPVVDNKGLVPLMDASVTVKHALTQVAASMATNLAASLPTINLAGYPQRMRLKVSITPLDLLVTMNGLNCVQLEMRGVQFERTVRMPYLNQPTDPVISARWIQEYKDSVQEDALLVPVKIYASPKMHELRSYLAPYFIDPTKGILTGPIVQLPDSKLATNPPLYFALSTKDVPRASLLASLVAVMGQAELPSSGIPILPDGKSATKTDMIIRSITKDGVYTLDLPGMNFLFDKPNIKIAFADPLSLHVHYKGKNYVRIFFDEGFTLVGGKDPSPMPLRVILSLDAFGAARAREDRKIFSELIETLILGKESKEEIQVDVKLGDAAGMRLPVYYPARKIQISPTVDLSQFGPLIRRSMPYADELKVKRVSLKQGFSMLKSFLDELRKTDVFNAKYNVNVEELFAELKSIVLEKLNLANPSGMQLSVAGLILPFSYYSISEKTDVKLILIVADPRCIERGRRAFAEGASLQDAVEACIRELDAEEDPARVFLKTADPPPFSLLHVDQKGGMSKTWNPKDLLTMNPFIGEKKRDWTAYALQKTVGKYVKDKLDALQYVVEPAMQFNSDGQSICLQQPDSTNLFLRFVSSSEIFLHRLELQLNPVAASNQFSDPCQQSKKCVPALLSPLSALSAGKNIRVKDANGAAKSFSYPLDFLASHSQDSCFYFEPAVEVHSAWQVSATYEQGGGPVEVFAMVFKFAGEGLTAGRQPNHLPEHSLSLMLDLAKMQVFVYEGDEPKLRREQFGIVAGSSAPKLNSPMEVKVRYEPAAGRLLLAIKDVKANSTQYSVFPDLDLIQMMQKGVSPQDLSRNLMYIGLAGWIDSKENHADRTLRLLDVAVNPIKPDLSRSYILADPALMRSALPALPGQIILQLADSCGERLWAVPSNIAGFLTARLRPCTPPASLHQWQMCMAHGVNGRCPANAVLRNTFENASDVVLLAKSCKFDPAIKAYRIAYETHIPGPYYLDLALVEPTRTSLSAADPISPIQWHTVKDAVVYIAPLT